MLDPFQQRINEKPTIFSQQSHHYLNNNLYFKCLQNLFIFSYFLYRFFLIITNY